MVACKNDVQKIISIEQASNLPAQRITDAEILYSDSGFIKAKVNAPIMEYYRTDNPYTEFKKGVKVVFYDKDMKPETQMSANYAIKKEKENLVDARNNVIVTNINGDQLNTEHLIWEENKDKIRSDAFVKITRKTKGDVIIGNGLESNQSFTKYHILKVKGVFSLKDSPDSLKN
jgi:LPS export ABC transporter protein LptC